MAVNLKPPSKLLPVAGVSLATAEAGIRYQGRKDLLLMAIEPGATCSAVFTQNKCCAAPVVVAKEHLQQNEIRALLVNSGNANAVTGAQGVVDAKQSCECVAELMGVNANQVLPFSTGVIGEQLNMSAMNAGISACEGEFLTDAWLSAAEAIMTTDTVAKACSRTIDVAGELITVTGIAKGSGMICPNMATMLAYVATDGNIKQADLDRLLRQVVADSFNRITVDSDTSTNDALVLVATGKAQEKPMNESELDEFYPALEELMIDLATSIIRDGEGATKFVKVSVGGAETEEEASAVAYSIAHSPLVKTALFASDPNWGRILMALGKSPIENLDMAQVDIKIGDVSLIEQGEPAASYTEELGQGVFNQAEIDISIDLNLGSANYHVWTSDLSHDYVSINADYRS